MRLQRFFAAIGLATISLTLSALGQQSVRTPEQPEFTKFLNPPPTTTLFRLGPFSGTAGLSTGYEFNDNAGTSNSQKISQNQFFEGMSLELAWILSPFNRINVTFDGEVQQNFYSNGQNAINVQILPGSDIQLVARVGDVLLRAYEQFAIVQDPVTDPVATGQTNLNRLTNTLGFGVTVPFYPFSVETVFDYTYSDSLGSTNVVGTSASSGPGGTVRSSLHLGATLGYQISSLVACGLDFNASTNYGAGPNDSQSLSVGPFVRGSISRLVQVDAGIGVLLLNAPQFNPTQYYASLSLRYQITEISQLVAGISHDVNFSSGLNLTKNNYLHLDLRTEPIRRLTVTIAPFLNFGTDQGTTQLDSYTQYGIAVDSSYQLSRNLTAGLNYRFVKRDGDLSSDRYTQNVFGITLAYKF